MNPTDNKHQQHQNAPPSPAPAAHQAPAAQAPIAPVPAPAAPPAAVPKQRRQGRGRQHKGKIAVAPPSTSSAASTAPPTPKQEAPPKPVDPPVRAPTNKRLTKEQVEWCAKACGWSREQVQAYYDLPRTVSHPHPVANIIRGQAEYLAWQEMTKPAPDAKYIDIWGSVPRNEHRTNTWTLAPEVVEADALRTAVARRSANTRWCMCSLDEFLQPGLCCDRSRDFFGKEPPESAMMIDCLYYVNPQQLAAIVKKTRTKTVWAYAHQFEDARGTTCCGDVKYERDATGNVTVSVIDGGTAHYTHSALDWLRAKSAAIPGGALAWRTVHVWGPTKQQSVTYMFTVSDLPPRPEACVTPVDEVGLTAYGPIDITGRLTAAQKEMPMWTHLKEARAMYKAGNHILVRYEDRNLAVPYQIVVKVIVKLAGEPRTAETWKVAVAYAREQARSLNIGFRDIADASSIETAAAIAFVKGFEHTEAVLEHVVGDDSLSHRYKAHAERLKSFAPVGWLERIGNYAREAWSQVGWTTVGKTMTALALLAAIIKFYRWLRAPRIIRGRPLSLIAPGVAPQPTASVLQTNLHFGYDGERVVQHAAVRVPGVVHAQRTVEIEDSFIAKLRKLWAWITRKIPILKRLIPKWPTWSYRAVSDWDTETGVSARIVATAGDYSYTVATSLEQAPTAARCSEVVGSSTPPRPFPNYPELEDFDLLKGPPDFDGLQLFVLYSWIGFVLTSYGYAGMYACKGLWWLYKKATTPTPPPPVWTRPEAVVYTECKEGAKLQPLRPNTKLRPTQLTPEPCKPRVACVAHGPVFLDLKPRYPQSCVHNEIVAFHNRHACVTPQPEPHFWSFALFLPQVTMLRGRIGPDAVPSVEEWMARFEGPRRAKLQEAYDADKPVKWACRSFIKMEKHLKPNFKPRLIQGVVLEYQILTGPPVYAFSKLLMRSWDGKPRKFGKRILRTPYYSSGRTAEELSEYFDSLIEEGFTEPIDLDGKAFDSSVSRPSLQFEHRVISKAFVQPSQMVEYALYMMEKENRGPQGLTKCGIEYKIEQTRPSGTNRTSCGNTLHTGSMTSDAEQRVAKRREVAEQVCTALVQGDDACVMSKPQYTDDVYTAMHQCYVEGGFVPEMRRRGRWEFVEFCSGYFYPVGYDKHLLAPKLGRTLLKGFWSDLANYSASRRAAVAVSMYYQSSFLPIVGVMAQVVIEDTDAKLERPAELRFKIHQAQPRKCNAYTRSRVAEFYGVSENALLNAEIWLRETKARLPWNEAPNYIQVTVRDIIYRDVPDARLLMDE